MKKIIWAIAFSTTLFLASCGSKEATSNAPEMAMDAAETTQGNMAADSGMDHSQMDGMDHSQMDGMDKAMASKDIHLVSPEAEALPMGDAELVVHIAQDGLAADDVRVEVAMPMEGEEMMTAMAIVEAGDGEKEFKIKTNFGMAGPWTVHVMAPDAEPAILAFNIQ